MSNNGQRKQIEGMDTFGVTFTPKNHREFKAGLSQCKTDEDLFLFEGKQWLASYARILDAWLDGVWFAGKTEYKYDGDGS